MSRNEIYTVIQCKHCKWKSNPLNREELQELGVPWYCDNCGKKATYIHEGTLDELKKVLDNNMILGYNDSRIKGESS